MTRHSFFPRFIQCLLACFAALFSLTATALNFEGSGLAGDYAGVAPPAAKLTAMERRYTAAHLRLQKNGSYELSEMFEQMPYQSAGRWQTQGNTLTLTADVSAQPPGAKLKGSLPQLPAAISKDYAAQALVYSGGVNRQAAVSTQMYEIKNKAGLVLVRVLSVDGQHVFGGIRVKLNFSDGQTFSSSDVMQTMTDSTGRYYYQLAPGQKIKSVSLGVSAIGEMGSPSRTCQLAGGRSGGVALGGDLQQNLGVFEVNSTMPFFDFSFSPNRMDTPNERVSVFAVKNGKLTAQDSSSMFQKNWIFAKGKRAVPACLS